MTPSHLRSAVQATATLIVFTLAGCAIPLPPTTGVAPKSEWISALEDDAVLKHGAALILVVVPPESMPMDPALQPTRGILLHVEPVTRLPTTIHLGSLPISPLRRLGGTVSLERKGKRTLRMDTDLSFAGFRYKEHFTSTTLASDRLSVWRVMSSDRDRNDSLLVIYIEAVGSGT